MIKTKNAVSTYSNELLSPEEWRAKQNYHQKKIAGILDPYLQKKQHHHKDPILDFLFEYYAFRPSHLKKWSPGIGVILQDAMPEEINPFDEITFSDKGAVLNPQRFPAHRKKSVQWILSVLQNSLEKEPHFGCFGMHEWAMMYKADNIRHNLPLRMSMDQLTAFVDSRPLVCTHFDAFRFFTDEAKPQNKFELSRETFTETEQPGCLHTNMDLYKWAFKMYPWIGSDLIRKAFLLALEARKIDMQASPYDLRGYSLKPIKIETEDGRLKYVKLQKEIYRRSVPIRELLIKKYKKLLSVI